MTIGRNEKCPCGSGEKFKKCCIDDPKYPGVKLNNGMSRKYMCEFALHTYSSQVTVVYPNKLEHVDVTSARYHIYMVNKIPRLSFIQDSLKIHESYIEVSVKQGVLKDTKVQNIKFSIVEGNHQEIFVEGVLKDDKTLKLNDYKGGGVEADVLNIYTRYAQTPLDTEVVYVGQSYGKDGKRDAIQRLAAHSTLQKILADTTNDNIEFQIAITLWDFTPQLIASMDGRSKSYIKSEKENLAHIEKVWTAPPLILDSHIINVTEAALINYFKPKYNEMFKNNFPDVNHKGYKFYYNYDYNAISVELDPECVNLKIFSEHTDFCRYSAIKYPLNSEEERKSIFSFM
ncbi:YecA family protein [Bacillus sp. AFS033286]|uniref:YecA family protein n=1 Tax=Bacillus sp. AFS033286 TaxID=2033498 RepID=UPI000BFE51B9|nr:SEC-C metal-binding domain-containing protein [Bacillus sp. AFS033286]PGX12076.1 preprotein translocase subunit SecA [Bacillus sp. AFS033286]